MCIRKTENISITAYKEQERYFRIQSKNRSEDQKISGPYITPRDIKYLRQNKRPDGWSKLMAYWSFLNKKWMEGNGGHWAGGTAFTVTTWTVNGPEQNPLQSRSHGQTDDGTFTIIFGATIQAQFNITH
jgi:hypothetical protein